jgi:hypothetical protein
MCIRRGGGVALEVIFLIVTNIRRGYSIVEIVEILKIL